ncbi:hypothetical protein P8935_17375 [Telmatobacter sp. DSM 110680]|uniref:Uncharacterized protein n=1 Tax=Telmatobacter sp. DSM 110680 TaxID=3036704 RepID=A0AAU7DG66_9BACT
MPTIGVLALTAWALTSSGQAKSPSENGNAERVAKIHSQLWHNEEPGETIAKRLQKTTGIVTVINDDDRVENDGAHAIQPPYPPIRMVEFACQSDAVVVARAESSVSHMTADLDFIYSEWKVRISSVLQDNRKSPIFVSSEISVVRAGGLLTINGRSVIGKEWNFPQFQPGDEYLLYLKYIPETGFYKAIAGRSFDLSHGAIPDAPYMNRSWDLVPVDELLRDTKAAIAAAGTTAYCNRKAVNQ